jgi:hypothetical protein
MATDILERFIVDDRVVDHGKVYVEQVYLRYLQNGSRD